MKIMTQMAIICFICLLGEAISLILPFPFPSSIIAMILVFLFLLWSPLKVYHIKKQTDFLLDNMAFFFLPPAVSIIENLHYMEGKITILLFICLVSVFTTFAVTAWTVTLVMKWEEKRKEKKHHAVL